MTSTFTPNNNSSTSVVPQEILDSVHKLSFVDEDENPLHIQSIRTLEKDRLIIFTHSIEKLASANYVLAITCSAANNTKTDANTDIKESTDDEIEIHEKIVSVTVTDNDISCVMIELLDKIMYDDVSPSLMVEYTYAKNGEWFLSSTTKEYLESYRAIKFKNWRDLLQETTCKSTFRRLMINGLITKLYGEDLFPSSEKDKKDWQVIDENGKLVSIPRTVYALRVWNAVKLCYEEIDVRLDGAPAENEEQEYWNNMLDTFKNQRGINFINNIMSGN